MTQAEHETSVAGETPQAGPAPAAGTRRRERTGVVVSDKMSKTVVVRVERAYRHPVYEKVVRRTRKFHAHDEHEIAHEGDTVRIRETRPLSKLKRWEVVAVVKAAQQPSSGGKVEA
ncbi:MAG: 30S ribosomal protein S17 [Verrucomicrobia bacterium]|nr:30S ribosomal protein S17 [Verrucomicrobiota bacterium]